MKENFGPIVMEHVGKGKLWKDEADESKRWVQKMIGWDDPMEEEKGLVEEICPNYAVLVEEKRAWIDKKPGPSKKHDT